MRIIEPYTEVVSSLQGMDVLKHIEKCGRVCYKSEDKITDESCVKFVQNILKRGHEAVLEHYSFTVKFIVDRGVSHELVRHRLASFCQESTRYVRYDGSSESKECTFIRPFFFEGTPLYAAWTSLMTEAERIYNLMLELGASPQEARSVLPNSTKTEVYMTANVREWRHFFKLRTAKAAHPQMRQVTIPLLEKCKEMFPILFDDIEVME